MQTKSGLGKITRPNRDDDDDDMDGTDTADVGSNGSGNDSDVDDEAGDEKNVSATQGERPGKAYQGEDAVEASEMRQKAGNMGGRGMMASDDEIKGQDVSDAEEMDGPAPKVIHGRGKPSGKEPEVSGAIVGSGESSEPRHFANVGHGEREATISGAHQGQHGGSNKGGMTGEGFEAGGRIGKESVKGPRGTKR